MQAHIKILSLCHYNHLDNSEQHRDNGEAVWERQIHANTCKWTVDDLQRSRRYLNMGNMRIRNHHTCPLIAIGFRSTNIIVWEKATLFETTFALLGMFNSSFLPFDFYTLWCSSKTLCQMLLVICSSIIPGLYITECEILIIFRKLGYRFIVTFYSHPPEIYQVTMIILQSDASWKTSIVDI